MFPPAFLNLIPVRQRPAVHGEVLTGDISGVVTQQEFGHLAQIPGVAEGVDRHAGQDGGFSLRGHDLLAHLAGEPAWGDAVDADVVVGPFHGQPSGQAADRGFAGAVGNYLDEAQVRGHAADVDNPSLEPALSQVRVADLAQGEEAGDVHLHDIPEFLDRELLGPVLFGDSRIVDDEV